MHTHRLTALSVASVATLFLSACGVTFHLDPVETGPIQTETLNVPKPEDSAAVWDVELSPGIGTVQVTPDGEKLVEGTIDYNVDALKPEVSVGAHTVRVRQGDLRGNLTLGKNVVNDWKIRLGKGVPMNLTLQTGATKGSYDFGGLSLRTVELNMGATETVIDFSQPNPDSADLLTVNGGAASITLNGLGNVNMQRGTIKAGAGDFRLRFDGALREDAEVEVEGGVSAIEINSGGNPVQVIFTSRVLTSVDAGNWDRNGQTYSSPEFANNTGPKVIVRVEVGIGKVRLVTGG